MMKNIKSDDEKNKTIREEEGYCNMDEPIACTSQSDNKLSDSERLEAVEPEEDRPIFLNNISANVFRKMMDWTEFHSEDVDSDSSDESPESSRVFNGTGDAKNNSSNKASNRTLGAGRRRKRFSDCDDNGLSLSNPIPQWDEMFIKSLKEEELYELMSACNYLDVRPLLSMCCKFVAAKLHGKSVDQVREMLKIVSDYTPEEEERLKKENAWAED
jgi:hypothetical protein